MPRIAAPSSPRTAIRPSRFRRLVLTWLALGLVGSAWACQVPVFRYALEYWQPDNYQIIVVAPAGQQTVAEPLLEQLRSAEDANMDVKLVLQQQDGTLVDDQHQPLPDAVAQQLREALRTTSLDAPQLLAFYPFTGVPQLAWSAELNSTNIDRLLHSPARQEIVERLLAGHSAVWVLVESGDAARDEQARRMLLDELQRLDQVIQLPAAQVLQADEKFNPDNEIPLQIRFSLVTVSRSDPAEAALVGMLLAHDPSAFDDNGPVAIPVFGRGRAFRGLGGSELAAVNIENHCQYVAGPCSCEIKRDNPGVDLLISAKWPTDFGNTGGSVPMPSLTGLGAFESALSPAIADASTSGADEIGTDSKTSSGIDADAPTTAGSTPAAESTGTSAEVASAGGGSDSLVHASPARALVWTLLTLAGGAVAAIALVSVWWQMRPGRTR